MPVIVRLHKPRSSSWAAVLYMEIMRPPASAQPGLCVPAAESAYLEHLGHSWTENRQDFDKYWSVFLEELNKQGQPDDYIHCLLGHPDQIQGDMQVASEMMATGLLYESFREPASRGSFQQV